MTNKKQLKQKVFIVIANYNGHLDTLDCLESIMKQRYSTFQTIVIENSKTDSSLKQISKWSTGQYNEIIATQFPEIIYPPTTKPISSVIVDEKDFQEHKFFQ
jgi:GT2 family glycosyltransferase